MVFCNITFKRRNYSYNLTCFATGNSASFAVLNKTISTYNFFSYVCYNKHIFEVRCSFEYYSRWFDKHIICFG